jgi:hypothetical protein
MNEAEALDRVAKARATLPEAVSRFRKGLPAGSIFMVIRAPRSAEYPDNPWAEEPEQLVIDSATGPQLTGHAWGKTGSEPVTFPASEVADWFIAGADGTLDGNWLTRCLDKKS